MDDRRCHPPPPSPIALCGTELCPLSNQPEMMKPHFCSNYRQNGQNPKHKQSWWNKWNSFVTKSLYISPRWEITENVSFEIFLLRYFHQFLSYFKVDMSGNTGFRFVHSNCKRSIQWDFFSDFQTRCMLSGYGGVKLVFISRWHLREMQKPSKVQSLIN